MASQSQTFCGFGSALRGSRAPRAGGGAGERGGPRGPRRIVVQDMVRVRAGDLDRLLHDVPVAVYDRGADPRGPRGDEVLEPERGGARGRGAEATFRRARSAAFGWMPQSPPRKCKSVYSSPTPAAWARSIAPPPAHPIRYLVRAVSRVRGRPAARRP